MTRRTALLVALWLGIAAPCGASAQSPVTGEATLEQYAKAWRVAAASLGATASVPVGLSKDPPAAAGAIGRLAEYQRQLNEAVIVLIKLRPPMDPQVMEMHFALLPMFQEATAASAAWVDGLRSGDDEDARLAEEWFWSVAGQIRSRTDLLAK